MAKVLQGKTNQSPPWEPAPATVDEILAIRDLVRGKANEQQQATFVRWLEKASGVSELEFRGDGERASAFASGKRFVGLQFFTLAKTNVPQEMRQEKRDG
ncbi:MAG TPA: hypothetical protein DCZ11_08835 [Gammaproteobacteria bacterium]|nr:hypothetical protein [Gammaproteobacteria bacterium]MCH78534.1 hypothetical protein [Gammaproteobacteria bacterium]